MPTLYSGEWKRFVETKGKKKIEKMSNSSVLLNYHGTHCPEPPDLNHIEVLPTS